MKNFAEYVDFAAGLMNLPIPPEYRSGVIENFEQMTAIASLVNEFPLGPDLEIGPVFDPGQGWEIRIDPD
ncbi:MAG: DUF4089 domain-containing protein [Oscillatoriales cyanobacterium RM2_1_1]|nr:DUF4089 domain-containing protein [Oscillatoriales cyanobacterium RM2_1_1]